VRGYARDIELDAETADDLHFHIRAMDEYWLEWYREKRKRDEQQAASRRPARVGPKPRNARR